MYHSPNESSTKEPNLLAELKRKARVHRHRSTAFSSDLTDIQNEIRKRRMFFLGSSVPLTSIVWKGGTLSMEAVHTLSEYLSIRTTDLWNRPYDKELRFCRQFYEMCFVAIANKFIKSQCLDDVIRMASCLCHEGKTTFKIAMTDILPASYTDMLSAFVEAINGERLPATFEDAVLGAVCILLGVLEDPFVEEEDA